MACAVGPSEGPDPVRTRIGFAALLIGAVAVRAFASTQFHVVFNDGPIFLAMAEALGDGRFDEVLAHPFHPLYPMAVAAVAAVTGTGLEASAIAVSIVGGAMAVLGVTLAARRAFDPLVGWCVGITVALHPWAVDFSSDVMSDGLYAGFYALGFAALVALIERPSAVRGGLVGVSARRLPIWCDRRVSGSRSSPPCCFCCGRCRTSAFARDPSAPRSRSRSRVSR